MGMPSRRSGRRQRPRNWVTGLLTALIMAVTVACSAGSDEPVAPLGRSQLLVDSAVLADLPTSGAPWSRLRAVADGDLGKPDLADQDNNNAARLLAAALVHVRTGEGSYREAVVAQLDQIPALPLDGARVLSVGRQIAGYAVTADLLGYREPAVVDFIRRIRTVRLGGHDRWFALAQASEDTASNWGAWALTSRIAASLYVGDTADVQRAAAVFHRFTGGSNEFTGWRETQDFDRTWACDPADWQGINPTGCGERAGAIVEDISRSAGSFPTIDDKGLMYSWEALGAAVLSARLLSRAGYPDVYKWGDQGLLRAAQFLQGHGGYPPEFAASMHVGWAINQVFDVQLGPLESAGHGRQYGFTDWLP